MSDYTPIKFLGASVINFNTSVGWGESPSSLTVNLVEDDLAGDSFNPVDVGQRVHFVADQFEFYGILVRWFKKRSESGNPIYEVVVEDARRILRGVRPSSTRVPSWGS